MSIQSQIESLETSRNVIRTKMISAGQATSTDKLSTLASNLDLSQNKEHKLLFHRAFAGIQELELDQDSSDIRSWVPVDEVKKYSDLLLVIHAPSVRHGYPSEEITVPVTTLDIMNEIRNSSNVIGLSVQQGTQTPSASLSNGAFAIYTVWEGYYLRYIYAYRSLYMDEVAADITLNVYIYGIK